MTICLLAPSDRQERNFYQSNYVVVDDDDCGTLAPHLKPAFNPSSQKSGFFCFGSNDNGNLEIHRPKTAREREALARLVKAAKSPTPEEKAETLIKKAEFFHRLNCRLHCSQVPNDVREVERERQVTPIGQTGCMTVIQYREWADEWRVRTQVDTVSGTMPTPQTGERISEMLSSRGAKKIAESCEYMATKGGYKTFVTGTFNEETRKKIELGETTIQREVSRAMDALQKMYQRGWVTESGEKVAGHKDGLAYCWVVEVPKNEHGEDNPHVHMLLGWRVRYRHFADWSARLERIWGNGYFHLEKIKDGLCAGAYMAKAAGYMTKAEGTDSQGVVRGNRYGISEVARAPGWVTVSKSQLHIMGQLIADVYDHLTVKYGEKYQERKRLNRDLEATPKTAKATRFKIGQRLQKVREELRALPVRCNKYQVILKGYGAANAFFTWAKGEAKALPEWLPEKPAGADWVEGAPVTLRDSHWFKKMQAGFQWMKRARRAWCDSSLAAFMKQKVENSERAIAEAFDCWFEYQSSAVEG